MVLERILLQTIKFDLQVEHPYQFLLKYAKQLKGKETAGIIAWEHEFISSYLFCPARSNCQIDKAGKIACFGGSLNAVVGTRLTEVLHSLYHSVGAASVLETHHLKAKSVLIQGLTVL